MTSPNFDPGDTSPFPTYASIERIVVGPSTSAVGITGDILAEHGRITSIWCAGDIGTPSNPVSIRAANGIEEIRTIREVFGEVNGIEFIFGKSIHADVNAKVNYTPTGDANNQGTIYLLESGGDLTGSVLADNLPGLAPGSRLNTLGGAGGIMVQGVIDAPITIVHNMDHSNIVGRAILQPIEIGRHLSGAIIAYGRPTTSDPDAGKMVSVKVGHGMNDDFPSFVPGFAGVGDGTSNSTPVNLDPAITDLQRWFATTPQFGAIDGLIRAEQSIGTVDIVTMGHRYSTGEVFKFQRPRIEAPVIGSLTIGDMEAGVVWSGRLEYTSGTVSNDPSNDFTAITVASIACVGPTSDAWFKSCPKFLVTGDVLGELHVDRLNASEAIQVFGKLGAIAEASCGCLPGLGSNGACGYLPVPHQEASPRGVVSWYDEPTDGIAERSVIRFHQPKKMAGQIILGNAAPTTETEAERWAGFIDLKPNAVRLTADSQQTLGNTSNKAPRYAYVAIECGGGAAGLVPFDYYANDSQPNTPPGEIRPVLRSNFTGGNPIRLRFYGPVTSAGAISDAVVISDDGQTNNVNALFSITKTPVNGFAREISIAPAPGQNPLGAYVVRPVLTGQNALLCDRLGAPGDEVAVAPFAYRFEIVDTLAFNPACDFNDDGFLDPDDLGDFINCYFAEAGSPGSCPAADWNGDNSVDPDDLGDFINAYFLTCWL